MTSASGDPVDGGLPPDAFHPFQDESYEDLVGTKPQVDFSDLPMTFLTDSGVEFLMPTQTYGPNLSTGLEPQINDDSIEALPDLDTLFRTSHGEVANQGTTKAGRHIAIDEAIQTGSDQLRSLLESDTEKEEEIITKPDNADSPNVPGRPSKDKQVIIKQESPEVEEIMSRFLPGQVIDLCDVEDLVIKREGDDDFFDWKSMANEIISISDSDDEDQTVDNETLIPASLLRARLKSGTANMYGDNIIELGSEKELGSALAPRLGTSLLGKKITPRPKATSEAIAKQYQQQRALREKMLALSGSAGPIEGLNGLKPPGLEGDPIDDDAWMSSDPKFDEEAAVTFRELKRSYKVKQRADANTIEDDYEFRRADKVEKARLKRLELDYLNSRGPGSEEGDSDEDALFVHQSPARRAKRPHAVASEDDQGSTAQGQKKQRLNSARDLEKDLESNLRAGIDGFLMKERREADKQKDNERSKKGGKTGKAAKTRAPRGAQSNTNGGKTWTRKDKSPRKKKPSQAGYLNNAASLLNSNVFESANAIRDLAPLPKSTAKNKAKALADMVANVPLGDRRRAGAEKEHIRKATVTLGKQKVNPDGDGGWKFTGISSSLHHHQVQGAAWMKERELGDSEPLGGILADGMGLGKTVMALTLIIANPPTRRDKHKSTLIVCPPSLLGQWEKEISKHVAQGAIRRIMSHYAGKRQSGLGAIDDMQNANIVLTTYQEVMRSYPKTNVPDDIDDLEKLQAWWMEIWEEDRDILHKAHFHRIILDESQAIKNHLSHTSVACRALMARHRWALSGTPIMNRIEELYPYFKFLRVEATGSFKDFTRHFCVAGSSDCNKRLHCMLDQIMIRRTMDDKVLGYPIVSLPATHQGTERLEFNLVERLIYKIVSRRFIRAINKASAMGELDHKTGYGLVMFLRLRQMAAHTFLIQEILQDMFGLDSVDRLEAAASLNETEENKPAKTIIVALRRMVAAKGEIIESTPDQQSVDLEAGATNELAIRFGQRLQGLKNTLKLEELRNEQLCHKCKNIPEDPWVTSCLHVYCKECLEFLAYAASKKDQESTSCLECGTLFETSKSCAGLKELVVDDFLDLSPDLRGRKVKTGKVNMHWVAYDDELVLSAKTIGVENQITRWLEEDPEKKIIVFSQFLMIMAILERVCQKNSWEYCTYNGKMSHQARDKTIEAFGKENSKMKIMIASLKCGGIGRELTHKEDLDRWDINEAPVNLTMASRVTCIDLWFNSCMEQQAFCRVWRIGQADETFVTRFIVNDTVDDRLDSMQKHKEFIIHGALDDKTITSGLSVQEVMRLFGDVILDKKTNKPFIAMDDDEKLDAILPPLADDEDDPIAWRK